MYTKHRIVILLIVVLLAFAFPATSKAEGADVNHYKMPEYQYYCGVYCYEYITDGGIVTEIANQDWNNEITIVSWRERTLNIYYRGNLIRSETSSNHHMVNKETLRNSVFKYQDHVTFTDYTNNLSCEVIFDALEKVSNGEYSMVFDHGEENCQPIQ